MCRAFVVAGGLAAALAFEASSVLAQEDDGFVSRETLETPAPDPGDPVGGPKQPLAVATTPPPPVEHAAPPPPPPGLGECTFFSEPVCPLSLVAELGFGGGQSESNVGLEDYGHFFLEGGLLARTPGVRDLHIGPVVELAVEVNDIAVSWIASPRMRARYFAGGTEFILEGSFGPAFQRFGYTGALETGTRVGAVTDLSFGWRGIVGPFAQLGALYDAGGNDGTDLRWAAGIRANLLGWAYALGAGLGGSKIL